MTGGISQPIVCCVSGAGENESPPNVTIQSATSALEMQDLTAVINLDAPAIGYDFLQSMLYTSLLVREQAQVNF